MAFWKEFQHLEIQLEEIKSATGNFDDNNEIGKGGFGKVYKGVVSHSKGQSMVALKRLNRKYGQGDTEFKKEIILLSRYTHKNLISLLGFCDEDGENILVYEYASLGSLDRHLKDATLMWRQRLKICLDAAKGLCYLHDPKETQQRVIHRDIKSANILLDEYWNAKISDMGLSKEVPVNQDHSFVATNVVGTIGYVDPMYMETSIVTKELDVYSFGVVLLEVLCGRLCFEKVDGHLQSLVRMWTQSYEQKRLDEIIFQDLKQDMDRRSLEEFSDIAYRCLHKSSEKRPRMSLVVEQLKIALRFQEISAEVEPLAISAGVEPLVDYGDYRSEEELNMILPEGTRVNLGETNNWGSTLSIVIVAQMLGTLTLVEASLVIYQMKYPPTHETLETVIRVPPGTTAAMAFESINLDSHIRTLLYRTTGPVVLASITIAPFISVLFTMWAKNRKSSPNESLWSVIVAVMLFMLALVQIFGDTDPHMTMFSRVLKFGPLIHLLLFLLVKRKCELVALQTKLHLVAQFFSGMYILCHYTVLYVADEIFY